jgi:hypothetical protein
MIARSAAYQIKYYVLAVSEWFSHGLGRKPTIEHPAATLNGATRRSRTQFAWLGQQLHPFRHRIAEDVVRRCVLQRGTR